MHQHDPQRRTKLLWLWLPLWSCDAGCGWGVWWLWLVSWMWWWARGSIVPRLPHMAQAPSHWRQQFPGSRNDSNIPKAIPNSRPQIRPKVNPQTEAKPGHFMSCRREYQVQGQWPAKTITCKDNQLRTKIISCKYNHLGRHSPEDRNAMTWKDRWSPTEIGWTNCIRLWTGSQYFKPSKHILSEQVARIFIELFLEFSLGDVSLGYVLKLMFHTFGFKTYPSKTYPSEDSKNKPTIIYTTRSDRICFEGSSINIFLVFLDEAGHARQSWLFKRTSTDLSRIRICMDMRVLYCCLRRQCGVNKCKCCVDLMRIPNSWMHNSGSGWWWHRPWANLTSPGDVSQNWRRYCTLQSRQYRCSFFAKDKMDPHQVENKMNVYLAKDKVDPHVLKQKVNLHLAKDKVDPHLARNTGYLHLAKDKVGPYMAKVIMGAMSEPAKLYMEYMF